jgi:iron complex outermembrane recepter protein
MQKFTIVLLCLLFSVVANAQKISGTVKDENGKAKKGVTVSLLRSKDSSVVKYAPTNENGGFEFSNIAAGEYRVSTTHVGYTPVISPNPWQ